MFNIKMLLAVFFVSASAFSFVDYGYDSMEINDVKLTNITIDTTYGDSNLVLRDGHVRIAKYVPEYNADTYDPTGWNSIVHDDSLKFRNSDRYVKHAGTHEWFFKGRKYTKTDDSIQIPATNGLWYVYYDTTMTIQASQTLQPYYLPYVASVYWNSTQSIGVCGDQRHSCIMSWKSHLHAHQTTGAYYRTGLALTAGNTSFTLEAGGITDDDIEHNHASVAKCNLLYYNGSSTFTIDTGNTTLYKGTPGSLYYNNGTTLTAATSNYFVATHVFATNEINGVPIGVLGQRQDVNIANAKLYNIVDSLTLSTLPVNEYVHIYSVYYRNDATPYEDAVDYRGSKMVGGTGGSTSNHALLSNLEWASSGHFGKVDSAAVADSAKKADTSHVALFADTSYKSSIADTILNDIPISQVTYLQDTLNRIDGRTVGPITMPTFSNNGDGSFDIGSSTVHLRDNVNHTGAILPYTVPAATLTPTVQDTLSIVAAIYNSGSPIYAILPYPTLANNSDTTAIYAIIRTGNWVHSLSVGTTGRGLVNDLNQAIQYTEPYKFINGDNTTLNCYETSTPTNRTITVNGGYLYALNRLAYVGDYNSSTDPLVMLYKSGGVWQADTQSYYNNNAYQNGADTATMSNNHYSLRWEWRTIGDDNEVFYILGTGQYNKLSDALAEPLPSYDSLPQLLRWHGFLVGVSVIEKGASDGTTFSIAHADLGTGIIFSGAFFTKQELQNGTETLFLDSINARAITSDSVKPNYYVIASPTKQLKGSKLIDTLSGVGIKSSDLILNYDYGLKIGSNYNYLKRFASGTEQMVLSDAGSINLILDSDDNSTTTMFTIRKNDTTVAGSTEIFSVSEAGNVAVSGDLTADSSAFRTLYLSGVPAVPITDSILIMSKGVVSRISGSSLRTGIGAATPQQVQDTTFKYISGTSGQAAQFNGAHSITSVIRVDSARGADLLDGREGIYHDTVFHGGINAAIALKLNISDTSVFARDVDLSSYYTKTESDGRYVNEVGDTMSGNLFFNYNYGTKFGSNYNYLKRFASGTEQMVLSDAGSINLILDSDDNSTTTMFTIRKNDTTVAGSSEIFSVSEAGDAEVLGKLEAGSTSKTSNNTVKSLAGDSYNAGFEAYGSSTGTGYLFLGGSSTNGGGLVNNSDGTPAFVINEPAGTVFYRRESGSNWPMLSYPDNADSILFHVQTNFGQQAFFDNDILAKEDIYCGERLLLNYSETNTDNLIAVNTANFHDTCSLILTASRDPNSPSNQERSGKIQIYGDNYGSPAYAGAVSISAVVRSPSTYNPTEVRVSESTILMGVRDAYLSLTSADDTIELNNLETIRIGRSDSRGIELREDNNIKAYGNNISINLNVDTIGVDFFLPCTLYGSSGTVFVTDSVKVKRLGNQYTIGIPEMLESSVYAENMYLKFSPDSIPDHWEQSESFHSIPIKYAGVPISGILQRDEADRKRWFILMYDGTPVDAFGNDCGLVATTINILAD